MNIVTKTVFSIGAYYVSSALQATFEKKCDEYARARLNFRAGTPSPEDWSIEKNASFLIKTPNNRAIIRGIGAVMHLFSMRMLTSHLMGTLLSLPKITETCVLAVDAAKYSYSKGLSHRPTYTAGKVLRLMNRLISTTALGVCALPLLKDRPLVFFATATFCAFESIIALTHLVFISMADRKDPKTFHLLRDEFYIPSLVKRSLGIRRQAQEKTG